MFIKLTNVFGQYAGDPIYININHIVSILENHVPGGSLQTVLYSTNKDTFQVEESVKEVIRKIEEAKNDRS